MKWIKYKKAPSFPWTDWVGAGGGGVGLSSWCPAPQRKFCHLVDENTHCRSFNVAKHSSVSRVSTMWPLILQGLHRRGGVRYKCFYMRIMGIFRYFCCKLHTQPFTPSAEVSRIEVFLQWLRHSGTQTMQMEHLKNKNWCSQQDDSNPHHRPFLLKSWGWTLHVSSDLILFEAEQTSCRLSVCGVGVLSDW